MIRYLALTALALSISIGAVTHAQEPGTARFEVVSIKRSAGDAQGGGMRTPPDGGFTMTNSPIRSILNSGSPIPVRDIVGIPDWAINERYDIIAKPPAGSTRTQNRDMMRNMLIERMKLAGHVEDREQDAFALVLARKDGRLGPNLTPSTADCSPPAPGTPPPAPASIDFENGCGSRMSGGMIVSGSMTLAQLGFSIQGLTGRLINDRTGLTARYKIKLQFAPPGAARPDAAATDDAPNIFTALQEQLGLKLEPEKSTVQVFVIDHLERPTEN